MVPVHGQGAAGVVPRSVEPRDDCRNRYPLHEPSRAISDVRVGFHEELVRVALLPYEEQYRFGRGQEQRHARRDTLFGSFRRVMDEDVLRRAVAERRMPGEKRCDMPVFAAREEDDVQLR